MGLVIVIYVFGLSHSLKGLNSYICLLFSAQIRELKMLRNVESEMQLEKWAFGFPFKYSCSLNKGLFVAGNRLTEAQGEAISKCHDEVVGDLGHDNN